MEEIMLYNACEVEYNIGEIKSIKLYKVIKTENINSIMVYINKHNNIFKDD